MDWRVLIFGPSGVGSTTTAGVLAERIKMEGKKAAAIDTDKCYWIETDPPYQIGRSDEETIAIIKGKMDKVDSWALSGPLCGWGEGFLTEPGIDLIVFLNPEPEVRNARLEARQKRKFGKEVEPGGKSYEINEKFMAKAKRYYTAGPETKSLAQHRLWIKEVQKRKIPVMEFAEDLKIEETVDIIMAKLKRLEKQKEFEAKYDLERGKDALSLLF